MDTLLRREVLATLVILTGVLLANFAITWILRSRVQMSREAKLRTSVFWRNASFLIAVVALIFVWGSELRAAALSLVALGVAVVLVRPVRPPGSSRPVRLGPAPAPGQLAR